MSHNNTHPELDEVPPTRPAGVPELPAPAGVPTIRIEPSAQGIELTFTNARGDARVLLNPRNARLIGEALIEQRPGRREWGIISPPSMAPIKPPEPGHEHG